MIIDAPGTKRSAGQFPGKGDYRVALICLILVLGTFVIYWPVVTYDFVNFDDFTYVSENAFVQRGLNADAFLWAFTTGHASNWHPLTWMSLMMDCELYGIGHPG